MAPGEEEETEEVEHELSEEDELADDEDPLDFDDELPAGEGPFADEGESNYGAKKVEKVKLGNGVDTTADVTELLKQVGRSKKKASKKR